MNLKLICCLGLMLGLASAGLKAADPVPTGTTISLDGAGWLAAPDPQNIGREQQWWLGPRPEAKPTRVPWIFPVGFKDYHGVLWQWRSLQLPPNPIPHGRTLIRFWSVYYRAEVWVNGIAVGRHDGADEPFVFDITDALKPGSPTLVAVRVLNPTKTPIDGLVVTKLPHRWPTSDRGDFSAGGSVYNYGGILDSVEIFQTPAVHLTDLNVVPDPKTGAIRLQIDAANAGARSRGQLEVTVAEASTGAILDSATSDLTFEPGENHRTTQLTVPHPRLWQLNDPHLYRVTARVSAADSGLFDQQSTRCGFRDFRIQGGYFCLNGKRLFLRSAHTGNGAPVGYVIPPPSDPEMLRRDLILAKTMGFNTLRILAGMATRGQLELADEIGILIYEESYASWYLEDSPQMAALFDRSVAAMIRRDRNHPSIVIWGLLNETPAWEHRHDQVQSTVFDHAVQSLPLVRSLDETRLVFLGSGRFDGHLGVGSVSNPGSHSWEYLLGAEAPGAGRTEPGPDFSSRTLDGPGLGYYPGAGDVHLYPALPQTPATLHLLRTLGEGTHPVWLSEYGYDPALDLLWTVRHYDQAGAEDYSSAFFRIGLSKFQKDWDRWHLADTFGRPEDYFQACVVAQTEIRTEGLNAIRSNPNLVGYNLTSLVDGYSGEGLITYFHELKPGMTDAIADGWAPLRWCLFTSTANAYRGSKIRLEAVLANEDVLRAGPHHARLEVFGPDARRVFARPLTFTIKSPEAAPAPPLALNLFAEDVTADWPEGKYRFVATLEDGVAAGGTAEFCVTDAALMPAVENPVVLWGDDPRLADWLAHHGIATAPFSAAAKGQRSEIILAGRTPPLGGAGAFSDLARVVRLGATVVFVDPALFPRAEASTDLASLGIKARLTGLPKIIVIADYWAKRHPIFAGLPAAGLLDYAYYRHLLNNQAWVRDDVPAEVVAGGIVSAARYYSGLSLTVDRLGSGRVILNCFNIEANLGTDPAAERLLRNLVRYAAIPAPGP